MNHVERFRALMNFQPVDRLPRWEWAMWWDLTIERWHGEGLPAEWNDVFEISQRFGLDPYKQFWFSTTDPTIEAVQHHVEGTVSTMDDYLRIRPSLYPDHSCAISAMQPWARRQAEGEVVVWTTLEGFFWFPRTLLGFERLMLAYYDQLSPPWTTICASGPRCIPPTVSRSPPCSPGQEDRPKAKSSCGPRWRGSSGFPARRLRLRPV